jgi:hypothetical protein
MLSSRSCGLIGVVKITESAPDGKKNLFERGVGIRMRIHRWISSFASLIVLIPVGTPALRASENSIPDGLLTGQEVKEESNGLTRFGQDLLKSLLGDVPIPKATGQSFTLLFDRHRSELESLGRTHQELIWETIEVVMEFLPSVKTLEVNGGQLRVNRKTYAKASRLLERCELLVTPGFAQDLRKAKAMVESRLREGDADSLIIDFKE